MSQAAEMDIHCAVLEARELARLTQAELARRAGTTQPAVAAYASGLEIDRELDAMLAKTPAERLWKWDSILEPIAARALRSWSSAQQRWWPTAYPSQFGPWTWPSAPSRTRWRQR